MLPAPGTSDQRSSADPLIAAFEEEQKSTVFSALSEYLHENLFCDVSLVVGHQILRAHKAVLASSSKFFYNAFNHFPSLSTIDLERELAPHGLNVTFEDVRLIIGILYCVGTVEISPPRIESLLLLAQVLGVPSLIKFLRGIKESLINDDSVRASLSPVKKALVYVLPPSIHSNRGETTRSLTFEQHSTSLFHSRRLLPEPAPIEEDLPSRSGSRATLASLSSFPFNPISSPATETNSNHPPILDSLDPSFLSQLNNLQANQIDDLENALLPHLHPTSSESQAPPTSANNEVTSLQFKKMTLTTTTTALEDSFNSTVDHENSVIQNNLDKELLPMLPEQNAEEMPKSCSTPIRKSTGNLSLTLQQASNIAAETAQNQQDLNPMDSPPTYETMNMEEIYELLPPKTTHISPSKASKQPTTERSEDPVKPLEDPEISNDDETEVKIPLNESEENDKSITLAVPGSSQSLTVNFTADTINKLRLSLISKNAKNVKKKSVFSCQLCSKCFPSKRMLAKHEKYHVDKNTSCKECGQVFNQKWKLEQHVAKEHVNQALECKDCGKQFQWHRNLLAHITLHHQREIRYRCKNCPLTFLKKKAFILHHREKHKEALEPWCSLCFDIFDNLKQREDHNCGKIENTGRITICHKHDPPMEFRHQNDLIEHIKTHHHESADNLNSLQKTCPVCNKKFLLKKNLMVHMKRFHETEGSNEGKLMCRYCPKGFLYKSELEAHENTHLGSKAFKCHCGKAYSSKKALYDHTKIVHSESKETYACDVCGKVLRDKYKLKYHMMVHSDKRNFKCSHCSTEFKGGENLRRHVMKFHKTINDSNTIKDT